ncbi:MAG: MlaD family protein [Endomicrobiales bacterium]
MISIVLLGNFQFQGGYNLSILFDDISGLPDKAKVKVAGVDVGGVQNIALEGNKAKVKIWIRKGVQFHRDARAEIVSTGIIGSKYLQLSRGSADAPLLQNGDVIVGKTPVSLENMVSDVMAKIDSLVQSFQGEEGKDIGRNLAQTLDNLRAVTGTLRAGLDQQETKITGIIDNLHSFSEDIAGITSENRENLKGMIAEIREAAGKLDRILARVDKGEGTIGKLISDPQMGEDLKTTFVELRETSKQANNVLRRLNLIETSWDYSGRYDLKYKVYRHDFGLRINPRPGKFYYLGGSNLGEDMGIKDPEPANTFNLLAGKQFGPVQIYAGVIRSKGGIGTRIKPLWKWHPWSRLEVTAEGYNFFRETPVAKPKVNAGARMEVTKWGFVGIQLEDLYYASSPNLYMNLVFRDDDIAYILGLVGLAGF